MKVIDFLHFHTLNENRFVRLRCCTYLALSSHSLCCSFGRYRTLAVWTEGWIQTDGEVMGNCQGKRKRKKDDSAVRVM